jgi:glucose/arabinose dehydrogenase
MKPYGIKKHRALLLVFLASALVFVGTAKDERSLPPPYATPSVYRLPKLVPKPRESILHLPSGFHVETFAEGFDCPRFMANGPSGEILVSDSFAALTPSQSLLKPAETPDPAVGSVYVLTVANQRKKLIGNLHRPYGLEFWHDYLYVAEAESVKRYRYDSKAQSVGPGQEVIALRGLAPFHWTRTLLFDRQHDKLYVAIGSGSNATIGEEPRRAAISRYNPDGTAGEIFASGLRNPIGLRWYPGTDSLWATVQERDNLGDDLVPDFLTHIQPKGFYGWPYAYIGAHEDPFNSGFKLLKHLITHPQAATQVAKISDLVKSTVTPDVLLGAHVAVLDFIFYTGQQFPPEYRGGAFLAFHGSSNRSKHVGYSVGFVPFKDGRPSGPVREFLTGWMLGPDRDEVWGRPVGLLQLADGSILLSDDGARKIWRVTYNGQ